MDSQEKHIASIIKRVYNLEQSLDLVSQRLERLEKIENLEPIKMEVKEIITKTKEVSKEIQDTSKVEKVTATAKKTAGKIKISTEDLEAKISGKWLNWIGITAIVIGMLFFLKYAFDNDWIGDLGKILIGIIVGIGMLGAAEYFLGEKHKGKYKVFSQALIGGGIAILYGSIFAAFSFYEFISQIPAFGLMIFITIISIFLSIRHNALAIAVIGLIGGFLTPIMVSTGTNNPVGLFTYVILLDIGVLAIAYYRDWKTLNFLCFVGTWILYSGWHATYGNFTYFENLSNLWVIESYVTAFFIIFAFLSFFYGIIHRKKANVFDLILVVLNAATYFIISYGLLENKYEIYLGFFAAFMAAVYIGLGYLSYTRNKEDKYLVMFLFGVALTFLTIAIPIQLEGIWVPLAWACQGVVLVYISFTLDSNKTRYGALFVFFITLMNLFTFNYNEYELISKGFDLFLNERFLIFLFVVVSFFASIFIYSKFKEKITKIDKVCGIVLLIVANFLLLTNFTAESDLYYEAKIFPIKEKATEYFDNKQLGDDYTPEEYDKASAEHQKKQDEYWKEVYNLRDQKQFVFSGIWIVYAGILFVIGIFKVSKIVRIMAISLAFVTILKVGLLDIWALETLYKIISSIVLGIVLLSISFLYQKNKNKIDEFILKDSG